jgi:hypothetical protein
MTCFVTNVHSRTAPERGCLSRSTLDSSETCGFSNAHLAIRAAAGGTPAPQKQRSLFWTNPFARRKVKPIKMDWLSDFAGRRPLFVRRHLIT